MTTIVDLAHCVRGACGRKYFFDFLGKSEIGLVGTFHLVSNPDAVPWSSKCQVAWAQTSKHQRVWPALGRIARGPLDYPF